MSTLKQIEEELYKLRNPDDVIEVVEDPLETKLMSLRNGAYNSSTSFLRNEKKDDWIKHYRMYNSKHYNYGNNKYTKENYYLSKFFIPKTHEFVKSQIASVIQSYFSNSDYVNVEAYNQNDLSSVMSAEYFKRCFNWNFEQLNNWWYSFVHDSTQNAILHNFVPIKAYWDFDNKIGIAKSIPIEDFRIHPGANPLDPINSSPYIIHIMKMYVYQIKERMRSEDDDVKWKDLKKEDFVRAMDGFEREVVYERNNQNYNEINYEESDYDDYSEIYVHENFFKYKDEDYLFYTINNKLVSKIHKVSDIYLQGRPFVIGYMYLEENKLYPESILKHLEHLQNMGNELVNYSYDSKKMSLFPRLMVRKSSKVDIRELKNARPDSLIHTSDPRQDIIPLTIPNQSTNLMPEQKMIDQHYDEVAGRLGQSNMQTQSTVGGMNTMLSSANQVAETAVRTFNEKTIEPVVRMLLRIEQLYGIDEKSKFKEIFTKSNLKELFNLDKIPDLNKDFLQKDFKMSVNLGFGSTNPQSKFEKLLATINSIKSITPNFNSIINTPEIIKELFNIQGYKNTDKFFNLKNADIVSQLEQQVQSLTQQLQNYEMDILNKAKADKLVAETQKANLEMGQIEANTMLTKARAVETGVKSQFGAIQGAVELATYQELGETADQMLINSGYVNPLEPNNPNEVNVIPPNGINQEQMNFGSLSDNLPENNNPLTPTSPYQDFNKGIEGGQDNTQGE